MNSNISQTINMLSYLEKLYLFILKHKLDSKKLSFSFSLSADSKYMNQSNHLYHLSKSETEGYSREDDKFNYQFNLFYLYKLLSETNV